MLLAEAPRDLLFIEPGGHSEEAYVVFQTRLLRGDVVRQRAVGSARRFLPLLAQEVEGFQHFFARLVGVDLDVVVRQGVGRKEPDDRAGPEQLLLDDAIQEVLAVLEELACLRALLGVVQDLGVASLHLPGVEEERPVYVRAYLLQWEIVERLYPEEVRLRWSVLVPLYLLAVGPRLFERGELGAGLAPGVLLTHLLVLGGYALGVARFMLLAHQVLHHAHGPRGVLYMDRGVLVVRLDVTRRGPRRGRRPADEQGNVKALPLHLLGVVHHLVQRRRNEAREPDDVGTLLFSGLQDLGRRYHHPEVYHFEVVALQDDADDVLPDVVHVALHGRHYDRALGLLGIALLLLDVRNQVGHGPLHHTRALDHLRQEHPARAEQVPNHVHPVHERTLDYLHRALVLVARLLNIVLDVLGDALDQSVLDALHRRPRAPLLSLRLRVALASLAVLLGQLQEAFRSVVPAVQDYVLDGLAQLLVYLVVDLELAGVHDAHREPGVYGVIEEDGVYRLAHRVIAAEREGDVRDAARGLGVGEGLGDLTHRLDKVHAVVVVLLDAGGDGEDIRVEDDVLRREVHLFGKYLVGAGANLDLPLLCVRLPLEAHYDHGGAVLLQRLRPPDELLFTLLDADGVDDRLTLPALEARLDDRPFRGVDHDGYARDVRLARDEVEEVDHRLLAFEHPLVHVDVYDLGTVLHLILRYL